MSAPAVSAASASAAPAAAPVSRSASFSDVFATHTRVREDEAHIIFVMGASGDLAKKKTFPSLYDLFVAGLLPARSVIVGYARSSVKVEAFRDVLRPHLKGGTEETARAFLDKVHYRAGGYDDADAFKRAADEFQAVMAASTSGSEVVNRMFYFAIPPDVFTTAAATIHKGGMATKGWNRVVVEKPFGRDSETSAALSRDLSKFFSEDQIYRIDHYLGKEMVQNLMVLRFANAVFEPLWSREYISNIQITFKEPFGTEGRGGYFDGIGIIRDVMQNHLLQVLSLVAMEPPVSLSAEDVRNEKVKVLRCTAPVKLEDIVVGQYGPNASGTKPGYTDDAMVPKDSTTPTFATAVLHINNARWFGVPFILKCGKALNERKAEIRIQFRGPPMGLFAMVGEGKRHIGVGQGAVDPEHPVHQNELVIRIQPNEAVYLKMMSKMPGLEFVPVETELNLSYKSRYPTRSPPEAYARLLLDVLRGDQSQFVRSDELAAAWGIFTPILHQLERERLRPVVYHFGSRGPPQSDRLIARYGYVFGATYGSEWRAAADPEAAAAMLADIREEFRVPKERLFNFVNHFLGEMRRGLRGDPSSIKMIPSFVTAMPTGTESDTIWAIDMGGSNLRVVEVFLRGGHIERGREVKSQIPERLMSAPGSMLFDFVVDQMQAAGVPTGAPIGFTFSYPTQQLAVDKGTLIEWTKGFSSPGVVDMNVMELLDAACKRRGLDVKLAALVNDTVGTLMMRAYTDTSCKIGVIIGTGTNACYVERASQIPKWTGKKEGNMVVNMEWGGFGSQAMFPMLPFHEVDHMLDDLSPNPTKQRYEKMISGYYLGELTRLLLMRLFQAGALFVDPSASPKPRSREALAVPWSFGTALMSRIAVDESPELTDVEAVLRDNFKLTTRPADRRIVQEICALVARRAARLAAGGIAAVIMQMGAEAGEGLTAGIDGSVFQKYPHFKEWMSEALADLGVHCNLVNAEDGSGMGAALVAYASLHGTALRAADLGV